MKVLKRQGLTLFLIAALIVTLTLGIVFMMPAKSVDAADEFVPEETQTVSDEQALLDAVKNAGTKPTLIKLDANIVLQTAVSIDWNQTIGIDLNGHTLSRAGYVLVNWWGNLYLQDSSPEKTGTIADANTSGGTNVIGLVFNYGKMVSSVNYDVVYGSCVAITNQMRLYDDLQYICNPTLTITGGTIKHRSSSSSGVALLETIDGDLTITGGTFVGGSYQGPNSLLVNVSSTDLQPDFFPWDYMDDDYKYLTPEGQEKVDEALEEFRPKLEAYRPHRKSTVTIEGGDFTAFSPKCGVIKVALNVEEVTEFRCGEYSTGWGKDVVGPYDATVTITGGKWGRDLSGYTRDGYWMEHVQEKLQNGEIVEDFYQVAVADKNSAEASVKVNGKENYYLTVSSAFDAAKTTVADEHVIKLLKDATAKTISLKNVSGDVVFDLNGHKLKVDPESKSGTHIDESGSSSFKNRFVIRDTSTQQDGELELCASQGVSKQSFFYLYSGYTKVVLESGTIRQTGLLPETHKDYSTGKVTSSNDDELLYMSLFKFAPTGLPSGYLDKYNNEFQNSVTITGGNIISEMNFGTADNIVATHAGVLVGFDGPNYKNDEFGLVSKDGDNIPGKENMIGLDLEAYLADGTKSCVFSWDFNDILSPKGLSSTPRGNDYIVSKVSEGEYFLVGSSSEKCGTLAQALGKAQEGDTIYVLQDASIDEAVTIDRGIELNLNATTKFIVTVGEQGSITLTDGASIKYGVIEGGVTVTGDTKLSGTKITGNVAVTGGTLSIDSGTYEGTFDISNATLVITGGSYRGDQIQTLDQYFGNFLGAYIEAGKDYVPDTLYPVQLAPNLAAQKWYKDNSAKENFEIATTDEWNYFSLYVNSGADSFKGKTIKLVNDLDFGGATAGVSLFAVREGVKPFLPAGNATNEFEGSLTGAKDDGGNYVMSGIVAKEKLVGLFGRTVGTTKITNITVRNSTFTVGNGYLDELNAGAGTLYGGAIIGEAHNGTDQKNIELSGVTVDYDIKGYSIFSGAVLGHTWGSATVEDLKMTESSVSSNWKAGGVIGYYEESFTLKNGEISNVEVDTADSFFGPGAVVGHANGANTTFTDCQVEAPDQSLIGSSYSGRSKNVVINGAGTDIHVQSLGTESTENVQIELATDPETGTSSQVQLSANAGGKLPSNLTITDDKGNTIVDGGETVGDSGVKVDPENGSLVFEADPQVVDLYYTDESGTSVHQGSYASLKEALDAANSGDRIYINEDVVESITVDADKDVTINLYGHILTGTITVEGMLTLENGTVKGSVANNGTLTLAMGENGLVIDNTTAAAVTGNKYALTDEDPCVRETMSGDIVTKLELATSHGNAKYTADGTVITLSCEYCDKEYGTVTLYAPENTTFSGEEIKATVVVAPEGLVDMPEITYTNANGDTVAAITDAGKYTASITVGTATVSVTFTVQQKALVIGNIRDTIEYQGDKELVLMVTDYDLTDLEGNVVQLDGVTVTVTLQKSNYNVGKQVVLITAINMTGNDNYTLAAAGNQTFIQLEVAARALKVTVDRSGKVVYEGFAEGENESVLGGELHLEWVDNGDGTSTVTPSGLTSTNYVITFESGIVENEQSNNALWITLAVVGGVIAALGAVAVVYAVRRKKN